MIGTAAIAPGNSASQRRQRVRSRSIVLAGSFLGNMLCTNTVLSATMGIFINALGHEFGWSRTATSLAWTSFSGVAFLGTALIGRIADRLDAGRLAALSMLAFGLALLSAPHLLQGVTSLWIAYFLIALVGLGTSPVVLIKPVATEFTTKRGLAIGVSLTGVGLGNFVLPLLTTGLIGLGGWKWGYFGLGGCALLVAPVLAWTLGRGFRLAPVDLPTADPVYSGMEFREALGTRTFWVLSAVALLGGAGMAGPVAHLVPLLRDAAVSAGAAAALASLVGLAAIAGRLLTGITLDLIDRPLPGLLFLGVGALGALLLAFGALRYSWLSVMMIGFVVGTEMDLIAYFVSRYFGLRAHAAIFGWAYGVVCLGSAFSPLAVGALRDHFGNYSLAMALCAAALGLSGVLCLLLGRYRYAVLPDGST